MLVLSCIVVVLGFVIPVLFRALGCRRSRVIIGEAERCNSSLVAWGDGDLGS
jgi:hypothetical protein